MYHHLLIVYVLQLLICATFSANGSVLVPPEATDTDFNSNIQHVNYNGKSSLNGLAPDDAEVTLTQVIFRNGDRTPFLTWPNDENNDDNIEDTIGFGQLTQKGKQQCYELGEWFRARYGNTSILQSGYSPSKIYIRSADEDRCLQCASALAAGMFPPQRLDDHLNSDLHWQPVAIHAVPGHVDRFLSETLDCEAYHRAYAQLMQTALFRQLHMKSKYVFNEMSNHTGMKITKPSEALNVRDAMLIHESNNKSLTEWAQSISHSIELEQMYHTLHRASTQTPTLARLRSGFLLKEILDRASGYINQQVYMYSGHGSTITNMMNTLRVYNSKPVPYTASLLFESVYRNSEPHLRILYLYERSVDPVQLVIPECEPMCPVRRLYEIYANVLPYKSFEEECAAMDDGSNVKSASFVAKVKRTWSKIFG